jgi:hypothetical protein
MSFLERLGSFGLFLTLVLLHCSGQVSGQWGLSYFVHKSDCKKKKDHYFYVESCWQKPDTKFKQRMFEKFSAAAAAVDLVVKVKEHYRPSIDEWYEKLKKKDYASFQKWSWELGNHFWNCGFYISMDMVENELMTKTTFEKYCATWKILAVFGEINPIMQTCPNGYPVSDKEVDDLHSVCEKLEKDLYKQEDPSIEYFIDLVEKHNPLSVFGHTFPLPEQQKKRWEASMRELLPKERRTCVELARLRSCAGMHAWPLSQPPSHAVAATVCLNKCAYSIMPRAS